LIELYNFLKYKRNWKKCPYCGGKMERTKEGFGDSYKCIDYCGKDYPKEFLIRVPGRTKFYYFLRKIMRNPKKRLIEIE